MLKRHRWIIYSVSALILFVAVFALLVQGVPARKGAATPTSNPGGSGLRKVYSPSIVTDPYVKDQWEKSVRALEAACRETGEYCDEAAQARDSVRK